MKGEHVNRPNFDMFRDARMFLFPEQDDSNQTKQHIVNQLFKSIAVDTTSRFRSVLNRFVLRRTIEMLLEKIQDLEESARAQGARFKEQRNKLTSELSENAEALRVAEGRLSYLDTKDHELLCELTRKHEFKLRRPTPNFTFDHNSDFPVRHVLKEKSEKSIWAPDESELGTKRYIAVLRNRPLTRAFGKVQLFGWRKEMHHVEITSLRNSLSKLRGVKGNVDSQLQDVRNSLVAVNKTVTRCRVQRDACISNLRLLDLPYLASWPLSLVLGLLRDDNVHGLAKVYGLTGQFLKSSLGLSDSDGPSEISFQTHQTMVDVLAQHLEGNRAMLDDLASKRISLQQSYPFDRKGEEQPLNSSLTSLSLASTEGSTHVKGIAEEACSIVTSFALSMQDLQNSQLQLLSEIEANVQGAEETYSRQVRLISDTRFERQCGKEILSLIKGQSLPIGGFASLLNQESSVEAYISMFEGERAVRP